MAEKKRGESENAAAAAAEFVFADNNAARAVCGACDENLGLIAAASGARIYMRGNRLRLAGEPAAMRLARQALERLYALTQAGAAADKAETQGILAVLGAESAPPAGAAAEPLSAREAAAVFTKKPRLRPAAKAESDAKAEAKFETAAPAAAPAFARISTRKKTLYARTAAQNGYIQAMREAQLIFGIGPAGTGKTYLAVAWAAALLEQGLVERIILSRPAVEAGERLGFLPGDMKDKVDPYLRPLYDALYDMMPAAKVERALAQGIIEIAPLAFMRGRTLAHAAIILDEAQNTTSMQMKMLLTRLGEGSHMVINGDPSQIDLPPGSQSGLLQAAKLLGGLEHIAFVRFTDADVVRHPLVAAIIRAYAAESGGGRNSGAAAGAAPNAAEAGAPSPLKRQSNG